MLVDGALPDGGAYVVSELRGGRPARGGRAPRAPRCPCATPGASPWSCIDAGLAVRRRESGRGDVVVASALVQADGHLRVTRFAARAGAGSRRRRPGGRRGGGRLCDAMLAGGDRSRQRLDETIADARAGRIALGRGAAPAPAGRRRGGRPAAVPTPAAPPTFAGWQWVVVGVMLLLVVAVVLLVLVLGSG